MIFVSLVMRGYPVRLNTRFLLVERPCLLDDDALLDASALRFDSYLLRYMGENLRMNLACAWAWSPSPPPLPSPINETVLLCRRVCAVESVGRGLLASDLQCADVNAERGLFAHPAILR